MDAKQEIIEKVTALVAVYHAGSWRLAFNAFDRNGDNRINGEELSELLAAAGVGNRLTRSAWVRGVIAEMDTDHDECVSFDEFLTAIK